MLGSFAEFVVEDAALAWLERLGYAVKHGPEIAPGELFAERGDYGQFVLTTRLRDAVVRLNPTLPIEAIGDAFRKLPVLKARRSMREPGRFIGSAWRSKYERRPCSDEDTSGLSRVPDFLDSSGNFG